MTQATPATASLRWVPLMLALFELVIYLSNDMYLPALPIMRRDLSVTLHLAQLSLTLWFLGGAVFNLLLGPVSDRFGRKPVLLLWGLLFVVGSFTCAVTTDAATFLAARFAQGSAVAAVAVCGYATVHELMDEMTAVKTLSWMGAITVLGPAVGPTLGGIVASWWSWRAIFLLLGVGSVLVLLAIIWRLPESHPPEMRTSLQIGSVLARYGRILGSRTFVLNTASASVLFGGTIAWIVSSPELLVEVQGYGLIAYGLLQFLMFGGFMIGAAVVNGRASLEGKDVLIQIGIATAFIGGVLAFLLPRAFAESPWLLLVGVFVYNLGNGLTFALFQRLAIDGCPEPAGAKMAVFATAMVTCATLGSLLVSMFGQNTQVFVAGMFAAAAVAVAAMRLCLGPRLEPGMQASK